MCDEIGNNLASWSSMSQVHVDTVPSSSSSSSSFVLEDDEDVLLLEESVTKQICS
jgi:hypothetical protein